MKNRLFKTLAIALMLSLILASGSALASSGHSYVIDGVHTAVPADEYDPTGVGDEFLGTDDNLISAYATWNPTADAGMGALYLAFEGSNILASGPLVTALYVVIDTDPKATDPATSGTGSTAQPTADGGGATYPFTANKVFRFTDRSGPDSVTQNPAPGTVYTCTGPSCSWDSGSSIPSGVQIFRNTDTGTTESTEIKIPYSALGSLANYANLKSIHVLIYWVDLTGTFDHLGAWPTTNNVVSAGTIPGNNPAYIAFYGWHLADSGVSPAGSTSPTAITLQSLDAKQSTETPLVWLLVIALPLALGAGALMLRRRRA